MADLGSYTSIGEMVAGAPGAAVGAGLDIGTSLLGGLGEADIAEKEYALKLKQLGLQEQEIAMKLQERRERREKQMRFAQAFNRLSGGK